MNNAVAAMNGVLLSDGYDISNMLSEVSSTSERDNIDASTFHLKDKEYILGMRAASLTTQFIRKGSLPAYQQLVNDAVSESAPHNILHAPEGLAVGKTAFVMRANQTSIEVGAPVNEVVGGSLIFVATGGSRKGTVLHTSRGTNSFSINELQTLTFDNVPGDLEHGVRRTGSYETFVFTPDISNAALEAGLEALYDGQTITVTGTLTTSTDPITGEDLYSGELEISFSIATNVAQLQVVSAETQRFVVQNGDLGDYTLNGGANFNLGITESNLQTNQRGLGGVYDNVIVKGVSNPYSGSGGSGSGSGSGGGPDGEAYFNLYFPFSVGSPISPAATGTGAVATRVYNYSTPSQVIEVSTDPEGEGNEGYYNIVTTSGATAAVDNAVPSARGWIAQLHVVRARGTTPTLDVTVEHSDDGIAWEPLAEFAQATGVYTERVVSTGEYEPVKRYARASYTIGGTSPQFAFAVALSRVS